MTCIPEEYKQDGKQYLLPSEGECKGILKLTGAVARESDSCMFVPTVVVTTGVGHIKIVVLIGDNNNNNVIVINDNWSDGEWWYWGQCCSPRPGTLLRIEFVKMHLGRK